MGIASEVSTQGSSSLGVRLRALIRRPRLDRGLAEGGDPTTAASRWRARQLTSPRKRRRLARELEHMVDVAEVPQALRGSAVPVNRDEIRSCRGLLFNVAAELSSEEPVTPRGVLMIQDLLRDGASPMYAGATEGALEFSLRHTRAALLLL